jgi:fatty-acyl-CoA synthase
MPARRAIVHGDVSWSYAEFDTVCNRLAHGLAARGLRSGDRLALLSRNSHQFVAIRFAVARLGAVLVPVNFMLTAEEVAYVLGHSGARMLCVEDEFAPVARDAVTDTAVETVICLGGDASAAQAGWIPFEQVSSPDD